MPRITIEKTVSFDYGHRLQKHEGKCRHYHGHHGVVKITCEADALDEVGRVIDFSVIKQEVGGWIDQCWDHGMILEIGDPLIMWLEDHEQKVFILNSPPTAENLAAYLLKAANELLYKSGVRVVQVEFFETPTSSVIAQG